jgi:hypothetical protein
VEKAGRASTASAARRINLGMVRTVDVISVSPLVQNEPTYGPARAPVRRFEIHVAIWFPKKTDSLPMER